jgi:hypothetical protein
MQVQQIFDSGNVFSPDVLDIDEKVLIDRFLSGIKTIASISLALKYPTIVSVGHVLVNAYKNLLAFSLATEYTFDGSEKVCVYSPWFRCALRVRHPSCFVSRQTLSSIRVMLNSLKILSVHRHDSLIMS